jgi:hypothetical protein
VGPQDPKGVSRDMARDLTSVAGELATLRGPQETPETVEGAKEGSAPRSATGEAQEGAEPRYWWQRWFGG